MPAFLDAQMYSVRCWVNVATPGIILTVDGDSKPTTKSSQASASGAFAEPPHWQRHRSFQTGPEGEVKSRKESQNNIAEVQKLERIVAAQQERIRGLENRLEEVIAEHRRNFDLETQTHLQERIQREQKVAYEEESHRQQQRHWDEERAQLTNAAQSLVSTQEDLETKLKMQQHEQRYWRNKYALESNKPLVMVRIRITPVDISNRFTIEPSGRALHLMQDEKGLPMRTRKQQTRQKFHFDRVFGPEDDNDSVREDIGPLIGSVANGHDVIIFTYGPTNSGKTYTIKALERCVKDLLFPEGEAAAPAVFIAYVCVLEPKVEDLVASKKAPAVSVECVRNTIRRPQDSEAAKLKRKPHLQWQEANTGAQLWFSLEQLRRKRSEANNGVNECSSRDNGICRIYSPKYKAGVTLVDLAGTEKLQKDLAPQAEMAVQSKKINQGNFAVRNVFEAMAGGKPLGPAIRNSKLTSILDGLGAFESTQGSISLLVVTLDLAADAVARYTLDWATTVSTPTHRICDRWGVVYFAKLFL